MPWRYILGGILVLALLVGATVLPDILPYLFGPKPPRYLPTPAPQMLPSAPTPPETNPPSAVSPPPIPATGTTAPPLTVINASSPTISAGSAMPPTSTAQLFEAYARLVTLLLGVASVLGLFFGYFVRKSLRETEEDVDKRFDRSLALWEKERATLLDQYKADATKLEAQIKISETLEKKMHELMQELTDALQSTRQSNEQPATVIGDAASKVDAQLENL